MRRFRLTAAAVLGCAAMALAPACALASSPVVTDCQTHNGLKGHYSVAQLQQALKSMPTTTAQYSNCEQIIQDQLNRQLSQGGHRGGGTGNSNSSSGGSSSVLPIVVIVVVVVVLAGGGYLYWRRRQGDGRS